MEAAGHIFRCDVIQTGSQHKGTMRVLPLSKSKSTQRVVVGDDVGVLQAFTAKDGVSNSAFKHLPTYSPILCVTLGSGKDQGDRIFLSTEQLVRGVSRKGSEFFRFLTNLTEHIHTLRIHDTHIYTAGTYYMNEMIESKDEHFYMAADKINDVIPVSISNPSSLDVVLACQDRSLKVIAGSELFYETALDGPVSSVVYWGSHPTELRGAGGVTLYAKELVYGTKNGVFGQVDMEPETVKSSWKVEGGTSSSGGGSQMRGGAFATGTTSNTASRAGVSTLFCSHDFSRSGQPDVVVGRDDGMLEVFEILKSGELVLTHSRNMSESIQALDYGYVTSGEAQELVVSTYSGRVVVLSSSPVGTVLSPDAAAAAAAGGEPVDGGSGGKSSGGGMAGRFLKKSANFFGVVRDKHGKDVELTQKQRNAQQVAALKHEVDELFEKVHHKRKTFQQQSSSLIAGSTNLAKVNGTFTLNPEDASYMLSVELPVPIFSVALHANVKMELLDTDATVAIVSETKDPTLQKAGRRSGGENGESGIQLSNTIGRYGAPSAGGEDSSSIEEGETLVTYRLCRDQGLARISIRVREGQVGALNVYIIPRVAPKTTRIASFKLKPLCLHMRTGEYDDSRPSNELKVIGKFTVAEIHMWVGMCLPEIPTKPPGDDRIEYVFVSTLMGTMLKCSYRSGEATFTTDAITPLAAIKEVITKEATARKQQINVTYKLNDTSLQHMCQMIAPKIEYQLSLARQVREIEALQEISMQEEEALNFLSPEFKEVLNKQEAIQAEFKRQPKQLAYLNYTVKTMMHDWYKFKGVNVRNRLQVIDEVFRDFSLSNLVSAVTMTDI
ncbi:Bardet-Biedl syndrome 7 protein [Pseudoscourfieldia marina]